MSGPVLIGLLDSGVGAELGHAVVAGRSFRLDEEDGSLSGPAGEDRLGHGSALARIIAAAAPAARFVNAQIFVSSFATAPAVVAAGLDWLVTQGVTIVNMSFGMRQDREILRRACDAACEAGLILLAAAPARGAMVYPAGYDGVVKVSGDARCAVEEISTLGGLQADFGAHPRPPVDIAGVRDGGPGGAGPGSAASGRLGGASFAVAHLCGVLAHHLSGHPGTGRAAALGYLEGIARYHGPERRGAAAPS